MLKYFKREPDLIIGGKENPYMLRWWIIPKNPIFNIYLHKFLRSDDDRALHDHPWLFNCSILLKGEYLEIVPENKKKWPEDLSTKAVWRRAVGVYFRPGIAPHRVQLFRKWIPSKTVFKGMRLAQEEPVWTIFITGPRIREWGFYCPKGWVLWTKFTNNSGNESTVGKGCDQ